MKLRKQIKVMRVAMILMLLLRIGHVFAATCGDVNSDDEIDIVDALLIAQDYVNLNPDNYDSTLADVNADGDIDIVDALLVAQFYVELIGGLNCGETPTPTQTPTDPTPQTCEEQMLELQAETDATYSGGIIDNKHAGYTGSGFIDTDNAIGAWIQWVVDTETTMVSLCSFRYACANDNRSMDLIVNGNNLGNLVFSASGSWTTWIEEKYEVSLKAGLNTIRLSATTSGGAPNIDTMDIDLCVPPPTPTPTPTATPTATPTPTLTPAPTLTPRVGPNCGPEVGLHKVFEQSLTNNKSYSNKFTDVTLEVRYISPSNKIVDFYGFFDGDGNGGGNTTSGNVWKMRFMPDELGVWNYTWSWSDGTPGGQGSFNAVEEGAGKGILRPYKDNPRWFAYNGTEPVFLKSYYENSMRAFAQPWDCVRNLYETLVDRGYNHLQVNWLLPTFASIDISGCSGPSTGTKAIYQETGKASTTMQLDVWNEMDSLLGWLNDQNVHLFMFLGFDGGRNNAPQAWAKLSDREQDFLVRYTVSRIGPYAIIMWNYVREVEGNTENGELGCMRLVKKYDVFDHPRTYQDEKPTSNYFHLPEYNFAGVENHRIHSNNREPEYWAASWTHHEACLIGYLPGKPVYMVEGNALWRFYWFNKIKSETGHTVTMDEFRQSAWGCATAAASFTWCGHTAVGLGGSSGVPFITGDHPYKSAAEAIDVLGDTMNNEVEFYRMIPQDSLLSGHDTHAVWCLAETGKQYLVFSSSGKSFTLNVASGNYNNNIWLNAKTGDTRNAGSVSGGSNQNFTPPNTSTDWVLILRS